MWMIWLGIGIAAMLIELLTPTALISIWFSAGGFVAAALAYADVSIVFQILAFAVVSIAFMIVIRPIATRYLRGNVIPTNADRLIGEIGVVSRTIEEDKWGEVYVKASYWSAVELEGNQVKKGSKVQVLAIEGAKLIVKEK